MRCHPIDLRPAFAVALGLRTFMPEDERGDAGPSSAADSVRHGADDAAGEGDEGTEDDGADDEPEELTEDDVKDPIKKRLSDEAAKHRRLRKAAEKQATELAARVAELEKVTTDEALTVENRQLRLELAWERATRTVAFTAHGAEGAWKLAQEDLATVIGEDGTVDATKVGAVVSGVIDRYPYLVAQEIIDEPAGDAFPQTHPSGPHTTGKVRQTAGADLTTLQHKFPALRSRR